MRKAYYLIFTLLLGASCCLPQKKTPMAEYPAKEFEEEYEYAEEDAADAEYDNSWELEPVDQNWYKQYKGSETRNWKLEHTELDITLDFKNSSISGFASLDLSPYFYSQDSLVLDAKKLNVEEVLDLSNKQNLKYQINPDSMQVTIYLDRKYKKGEKLAIKLKYNTSAKANMDRNGGAIASDDGYYFINTDRKRNIPMQFWTQGETESSSRWFPTLDAPNQKHSQRISVKVPDTMKVLSNGLKISSKISEGTKTVVWEQKKAHAVYLTMLAVGNWSVVKDKWKNLDVEYWVEKPFENQAKNIFGNTPEMMEFFSKYTGVEYPWDKYSQVVVRDFVSGAMENTSATVHMEALHQTPGELLDRPLEDYISHELFHQWFGDYVTAESWANISLNESFATYGEYLWKANKYGEIVADETLYGFKKSYENWGGYTGKTLLRHNYSTTNDVFDVTSYQKGALILHMLRNEIGDEAFRAGLKNYLTKHAFKNAEVDELRLCFEETSGLDLARFFDQWYKRPTYPSYQIDVVKESNEGYKLSIVQDADEYAFTYGKMDIRYSIESKVFNKTLFIDESSTSVDLGNIKPDWLVIDPNNKVLGTFGYTTDGAEKFFDLSRLYLAYTNVESPSIKSKLAETFEEMIAIETDFGNSVSIVKDQIDSLRVLMIRDAIMSKSAVLSRNVLFPFFNNTSDEKLGEMIGLDFIAAAVKDKSNPSELRNQCFNIVADLSKDSNYFKSYVNDPSILVSNSAIARIWKKDKLQSLVPEGLRNEEFSIATSWFKQSLFVGGNPSEQYDYYEVLKSHPHFNPTNTSELIDNIFTYVSDPSDFVYELLQSNNSVNLRAAVRAIDSRLERIGMVRGRSETSVIEEEKLLQQLKTKLEEGK